MTDGARPRLVERYRGFLPITDATPRITLGEGFTPLVRLGRLGAELGLRNLYAKVEGTNPTGSHKDRLAALAAATARELGAEVVTGASTGNNGAALAAYSARAGSFTAFCPNSISMSPTRPPSSIW